MHNPVALQSAHCCAASTRQLRRYPLPCHNKHRSRCHTIRHAAKAATYRQLSLLTEVSAAHLHQHEAPHLEQAFASVTSRLDEIYTELDSIFYSKGGYRIPISERKEIDATGGSSIYGELEASELPKLLYYLGMDDQSVFYDLGSGTGKAVLQVAMLTKIQKSVGIELSFSRHELAEAAVACVDGLGLGHSPVEFHHADISIAPLDGGTHFYFCSTAFGSSLCRKVAEKLSNSSSFQMLVTTRQLPFQPYLRKVGEFTCSYSWMNNSIAHVYVKSLASAPVSLLAKLYCSNGVCCLPQEFVLPVACHDEELLPSSSQRALQISLDTASIKAQHTN